MIYSKPCIKVDKIVIVYGKKKNYPSFGLTISKWQIPLEISENTRFFPNNSNINQHGTNFFPSVNRISIDWIFSFICHNMAGEIYRKLYYLRRKKILSYST